MSLAFDLFEERRRAEARRRRLAHAQRVILGWILAGLCLAATAATLFLALNHCLRLQP